MRKLNILILLFSFIITLQVVHASSVNATATSIENKEVYEVDESKISINLGLNFGTSDNPVQLNTKELSTSFIELKPELSYQKELIKDLFLVTAFEGQYKDFKDDLVSEVKSSLKAQLDLGLTYFINNHNEVGVVGSHVYNDSSGLNWLPTGIDEKNGRKIKFNQSFIEAYYAFNRLSYFIELSVNQVTNKNDSLVQDDFAPNGGALAEFKDDFDQLGFKAKLNYKLSDASNIYIEPSYSKRKYKERAARTTEGASNQLSNPKLSELHRGITLGYEYNDSFVTSEVKALYVREKDLVFKAHNANNLGIETKLSIPVANILKISGEYSWSQKDYDFFVVNPQQDPTSRDLRKDINKSWGVALSKEFKFSDVELKYSATSKDSNYLPSGNPVGSVYEEDIITLGFNIKL